MQSVEVTLTNRYAYITDCKPKLFAQLRDWWSYYESKARFTPAYKLHLAEVALAAREGRAPDMRIGWDGKKRFMNARGHLPSGLFRATRKDIAEELGIQFVVSKDLPEKPIVAPGKVVTDEKYRYQPECVDAMCRALRRGGGIVIAATAAGKTKIAADFFSRVRGYCLFIVDQRTLLYQAQEDLAKWSGEPVGIVGDSKYSVERITAATVQTLDCHLLDSKFLKWYRKVAVVIVDELHEQMSRRNFDVLEKINPLARYGLTATLELTKKPVRFKAWAFAGPVLYEFPYTEGRDLGVLEEGKAVQVLFREEGEGVVREYQEEYEEEITTNKTKLDACRLLVKWMVDQGRYVLVLAERRAHVHKLRALFRDIPHGVVIGGIKKEDKERYVAAFERGDIRLIIASRVFKKGVDIKRMDAIIDMAEYPSKNDARQKFGRGARKHADKHGFWYVDFATRGKGRFGKAGRSRARSLRTNGLEVVTIKASTPDKVFRMVTRILRKWTQIS